LEESQLIRLCIAKDRVAQKALYEQYSPMAYAICLRYLSNQFDACDCLQKSFIKAYANLGQVQSISSLAGWIKTVTIRTCLDHIRSKKQLKFNDLDHAKQTKGESVVELKLSDHNVEFDELCQLIDLMPEGYRTVFNLAILDEMSHEEIAKICDISIGTSRSQLFKARKMMQALIIQHYGQLTY